MFKRPATPADLIPRPEAYPNDQAAAAMFGKARRTWRYWQSR